MDRKNCVDGAIFMLLYNITSISSFDRVVNYSNEVIRRLGGGRDASKMIVDVHPHMINGRKLIDEGKALASDLGGRFVS
jgi:hypothetical protein